MAKTITKTASKIRNWCPRKCCWIILIFIGLATIASQYFSSPYQRHIIVSWSKQQGVQVIFKALAIENTWETRRLSNDTKLYTKPGVNTSILLPQDFCHRPVSLLIITASAPEHSNLRNAIRETWASYKNISIYNISTYFLMGQTYDQVLQESVRREFKNYSDIIQEEFLDGAYNKSLKSLMMLKIVTTHCPERIKYLLKTDDDVYVNVKVLEGFIKSEMSNLLVGHLMVGRKPIRDNKQKSMYCPLWMYGNSVYPTHLYGHNYILSADVVPKLYNASKYVPHFFIEGVYITGMLSKASKLEPVCDQMFVFAPRAMDPCVLATVAISSGLDEKQIRLIHRRLLKSDTSNCDGIILISHDKTEFRPSNGTVVDNKNPLQNVTIKLLYGL